MSSYDAAIIDLTITEDPALLTLPRGYRLLHLEAYVWSRAQRTDGAIPRHMLARIAFDEPERERAAAALVDAGLWTETALGWTILGFLDTQWSRETVKRKREQNRKRYEEWVAKQQEKGKRVGKRVTNEPDTDTDSDPDSEGKGESVGGSGDLSPRGPVAVPPTAEQNLIKRRDLARAIRECPDDLLRKRYRRTFDVEFGDLYGRQVAS